MSAAKIRVAEYLSQFLVDRGVKHVFMLTGGGAMFLNDAIGFHPGLKAVFHHHEQACAMAAEGYARVSGGIGVVNVTTGPGGINALNGVFGAWTDSVPLLVISGQVKRETCLAATPVPGLRQLGDQEAAIDRIVAPITKYVTVLTQPERVRFELEKAFSIATSGRPGPVWIDIPIDVQSSYVDPGSLAGFEEQPREWAVPDADIFKVLERLAGAQRPVLLAGTGVRAAGALEEFDRAIRALQIPVVTAWTHDLIASDDPLFCGRPGTIGTRAGNFVTQSSDVLLVIGSRLNIRQTSYNFAGFAPGAFKIQVDVDPAELAKPTVRADLRICCDAKGFLDRLTELAAESFPIGKHAEWLAWCKQRTILYPQVQPKHRDWSGRINPYHFIEELFKALGDRDVVVTGNATACIATFQAAHIKKGQRVFSNSGSASMGYDLPAGIGASFAAPAGGQVVCLAGDGSIQMNIQEFQTLVQYQPALKLFILNNRGYLSIRTSQGNFFKRLIGEGPGNGVSFPDYCKVAQAYGLRASRLDTVDFGDRIREILGTPGPFVCDVMLDDAQQFEPRMSSRQLEDGRIVTPPLEDMFPFLAREELAGNVRRSEVPLEPTP